MPPAYNRGLLFFLWRHGKNEDKKEKTTAGKCGYMVVGLNN
jgi:hypothetical protein